MSIKVLYFSERTSTNFFNYSLSDREEKTENVSSATFEGAYLRRYLKLGCNRIKYHRRVKSVDNHGTLYQKKKNTYGSVIQNKSCLDC